MHKHYRICGCILFIVFALLLIAAGCGGGGASSYPPANCVDDQIGIQGDPAPLRDFKLENSYLAMSDGTKLAVTYFLPDPLQSGERLPIVLESTPYRKDDDGFPYAYETYAYFPRRGIAIARVDVRGTGSSEGQLPDREYSDAELADLQAIVGQLAQQPWSNGNIGMLGISWSGFNSIMTAMRRPPELKAILTAHASDDLYGNDVHYIDGSLHIDIFALEMEVENIVPRSPDYLLDQAYFRDRFDQPPWILTYMRHQRDGNFWQPGRSLQSDWQAIDIPVYAMGALLDGYRDYVPHMLEHVTVPMRAEIGPWNHAWPHDGAPGPDYEWRQTAVRWWRRWLSGEDNDAFKGKCLTVFERAAVAPDENLQQTPGGVPA